MSTVGRLKSRKKKFEVTSSTYIKEVIENGYMLPFKTIPQSSLLRNNKSARDKTSIVEDEIVYLLWKGVVSEVRVVSSTVDVALEG